MFRIESRGRAVVWRQAETAPPSSTGTFAPRGKWSVVGRGFRARAYSHVSEGASSGTNNLSATGITTGQPTLGAPVIGQIQALAPDAITTGQPTLGLPAIGQIHLVVAIGLTAGLPTLGAPVLDGTPGAVDLLGVGTTTGAPTLGTPSIGQAHVLAAVGITTGAPVVGVAPPSGGPAVLGSLRGTVRKSYPQRPSNKQTGYRY
jgi:hypothetical protein